MRSGATAVEQSTGSEQERSGAYRAGPSGAGREAPDLRDETWVSERGVEVHPSWDEQRVESSGADMVEREIGRQPQARCALDGTSTGRGHSQLIAPVAAEQPRRHGEHLGRASQVQQ